MIKKNLTALRSCLDQEETLGSIITIKMESLNSPGAIELPLIVLKATKSTTRPIPDSFYVWGNVFPFEIVSFIACIQHFFVSMSVG